MRAPPVYLSQSQSCVCSVLSPLPPMRTSMLTRMGAEKRAGRRGLPPWPGQLDFSQPSDSVSLSSQATRQANKGRVPLLGHPGSVLAPSLALTTEIGSTCLKPLGTGGFQKTESGLSHLCIPALQHSLLVQLTLTEGWLSVRPWSILIHRLTR